MVVSQEQHVEHQLDMYHQKQAVGGPIGLVKEGDMIEIDIINHRIELLVSDEELEERRKNFKPNYQLSKDI